MKKLLSIVTVFYAFQVIGQEQLAAIDAVVTEREIRAQIGFLASDELRGREVGTPEIDIAAKYLSSQLEAYGAMPLEESYFQPVGFNIYGRAEETRFLIGKNKYEELVFLRGGNTNYSDKMVYAAFGSQEDYTKLDVKGKIVVVNAGWTEPFAVMEAFGARKDKVALAKANGAIGLIEVLPANTEAWPRIKHFLDKDERTVLAVEEAKEFIHIWALSTASAQLKKGKSVAGELIAAGMSKRQTISSNVIATISGSDPILKDEFVVYTAHYDHVGVGQPDAAGDSIFNGARDNAVGVSTVLMAAKYFGENPPKRSVMFVLFTGEEKGILGSEWFVERSPIPLDQFAYCLNSDNAGYTDKSAATVIGLAKTTVGALITQSIEQVGLRVIADPMAEQGLYGRSDNVHFAKAGIPAVNIGMGIESFDENIKKVYHKAADNPETLDYEYLTKYFRAYVNLARQLANTSERLYWEEGDQYFEAGERLYQKD